MRQNRGRQSERIKTPGLRRRRKRKQPPLLAAAEGLAPAAESRAPREPD
ncbi:Uncharacterised protein [Bordetella pertussis]|nr:Uncharacterised protein [Bordetella pertussis]